MEMATDTAPAGLGGKTAAPATGVAGGDFEGQIRIEQSIHLVGQLPTLVIGNLLGALIGFLLTVDYHSWLRLSYWLVILLLTLPMAYNWIKLRNRSRPGSVSRRRIRVAAFHSLALGLAWSMVPPVFLFELPQINQACLLFGLIVLCTGAVASISALPRSALAYFVPMMSMVFVVTANNGGIPYKPLTVLSGLMFVALLGFLRQNWMTFRRNVAIAVERTRLADMQRQEVERRGAIEAELRQAKDRAEAAAEEVRTVQKRLQSIIEALPLPVTILRLGDGRTLFANRWAAELIGLSTAQMMERRSTDFLPGAAEEERRVLDMLRNERTVVDYETSLQRSNGTKVPVRLASILMDYAGQKAILVVAEDITERKLHEEQMERSRQAAEEANRAKSRFLANMSHELRTPLNAVLGYTELMADGIYGDLPEKAVGVLDRVQKNGQHLLGLINDVLDLSKIEAGQVELHMEPYAWESIVQAVTATTEALARTKSLEMRVEVEPDLPHGRGDERRLTQVLLNLVGNAVKFTEAGHVAISVRRDGGDFVATVSDTGPGIGEEHQARIFDEFQQVDDTATRRKGGTGLGLAISKRLAEMHGGTLGVESTPGKGAVFTIRVPVEAVETEISK